MTASVISAIVSAIALLFSLFVYFRHERELKRLSVLATRLTLQKAIRDQEEDTSARVTAKIVRETGNNHISITNEGKVTAQNVQVKLEPDICNRPREYPFPRDVEPGQTIQISAYLGISGPSTVAVKIWWEDACHLGKPYFKEFNLPIFS